MTANRKPASGAKPAASTTPKDEKPLENLETTGAAAAPVVQGGDPAAPVTEQPTANAASAATAPQGAQETPSPETAMEGNVVDGLWIRSVPESFRRCGFRFTREGYGIALSALTDAQVEQLMADPNLVVKRGEFSHFGERLA